MMGSSWISRVAVDLQSSASHSLNMKYRYKKVMFLFFLASGKVLGAFFRINCQLLPQTRK